MKVDIGPYLPYYNTSRLEDKWIEWRYKKDAWEVDEKDYDFLDTSVLGLLEAYYYFVLKPINSFNHWRRRREKVRIDYYDTWSMDHTLALIIIPMLEQLKATNHGHPVPDVDDAPHIGKGEEEDYGGNDNKSSERWDWIMDEMIWAFKQVHGEWGDGNESYYHDPYEPGEEVGRTKIGDKYLISEEAARKRGKFNPDKYKAYNDRITNGLRLFGKYYRSLWD